LPGDAINQEGLNLATVTPLPDFLLSLPSFGSLSARSLILLVAYHLRRGGQTQFTRTELMGALSQGGIAPPNQLGVRLSQLSAGKTAPLIVSAGKYALSVFGLKEVQDYLGTTPTPVTQPTGLSALVGRIAGDAEQRFLAEAVACLEVKARRAAVVMVWLMTVDHLQRYVIAHRVADFNHAWVARPDFRVPILVQDDFLEIRDENTFIQILRSASIITNDVRKILDEKLGFRNTCAHPNDIVIPESKVLAAIEDLVYNVVLKYPL
jgi:hypothetical protein